jgi:pimeloyl-ACP methyl ester carboxylesterase
MGERLAGLALVATTDAPFDPTQATELQRASEFLPLIWSEETAALYAASLVGKRHLDAYPNWVSLWHEEVRHFDLPGMSNLIRAVVTRDDQRATVGQISTPIWVAHGGADTVLSATQAEAMAGRLGARMTQYETAGHCPPLECPAEFADDCFAFVTRCLEGASASSSIESDVRCESASPQA